MASQSSSIDPARRAAWAVMALVLAALLGWSAQAARRGWSPPDREAPVAPLAPQAAPTPDAPLAAAAAAAEIAAPARGTTGTIALPAPPPAAALPLSPADLGVVAARPFAFGRAPRLDRARALECLTAAVYYEAASEPDAGQAAVAQVVLNRVRHPAFPASVCGVVYQGSEKAGCQFSFACDGSIQRHPPSAAGWARAARAAAAALKGRVYAPVGLATHYHTYAVTPAWNRALVMTDAVGAHFFHRWKGWWGTPPAFRQLYAGGEPVPGPHVPPEPATIIAGVAYAAIDIAPVVAGPPPPVTPPATIRPEWRGGGTAIAVAPATDRLPPASAILPRWRESGQMIAQRALPKD